MVNQISIERREDKSLANLHTQFAVKRRPSALDSFEKNRLYTVNAGPADQYNSSYIVLLQ